MKIAVVGTHGCGKTTLTYLIAAEAKKRGFNAKVVNEVARSCPFALNDGFTMDGAHWIITQQINKELSAKAAKTEMIICDRSSIDPIIYISSKTEDAKSYEALYDYATDWMKTYDKIIWVFADICKLKDDGVRSTDEEFQAEIDRGFDIFFTAHFPEIFPLDMMSSDIFEGNLDKVMEYVFS